MSSQQVLIISDKPVTCGYGMVDCAVRQWEGRQLGGGGKGGTKHTRPGLGNQGGIYDAHWWILKNLSRFFSLQILNPLSLNITKQIIKIYIKLQHKLNNWWKNWWMKRKQNYETGIVGENVPFMFSSRIYTPDDEGYEVTAGHWKDASFPTPVDQPPLFIWATGAQRYGITR